MAEEEKTTNVLDDLDDLLAEVADAHLPGYQGSNIKPRKNEDSGIQQADDMAGLTAAQKKRRKKKNKKKEQRAMEENAAVGASSRNQAREMTHEELLAESKRRQMTPLREKLGASL